MLYAKRPMMKRSLFGVRLVKLVALNVWLGAMPTRSIRIQLGTVLAPKFPRTSSWGAFQRVALTVRPSTEAVVVLVVLAAGINSVTEFLL